MKVQQKETFLPNTHLIYLCVLTPSFLSVVPAEKKARLAGRNCICNVPGQMGQSDRRTGQQMTSILSSFLPPTMIASLRRGERSDGRRRNGCDVWPWALLLRYFPDGLRLASSRVISVHATFRKWFRDGRHAGNRNRCPNFPRSLEQQR